MAVGFKVADAYIEIHTEDDTRTGRQKVERDTSRWARGLGGKIGRIMGISLLAGIGRAITQALAMIAKLAALGLVAGTVATAIGGLASAIVNLIPLIAELVNAAIAASGALLLIPAAVATLITAVVTAKLGLKGMGDAMKAVASGDAAALNEALKKLAPNARAFVREIARLKPAFDRLRLRIQNQLFVGLARQIRDLGRAFLPILNEQLGAMARVLNGALRDAIAFLLSAQTRLDLARILNAAARATNNLRAGLAPILAILRDVTVVATEVLARLTAGFGQMLTGWAADIARLRQSGGLEQIIMDGLAAVKVLAGLLGDVVGIIRGLVKAAGGAGGLFSFFDRLNRLINSLEGQAVLKQLFSDLDRIGRALIPVLLAVLKALIPVIEGIAKIAEALSPGLTTLALMLGNALALLADPIASLAPLLFALGRGLAPLAAILGGLVKAATPGLTAFLEALVDGLIALVPVAPVVGRALGDLLIALAPLLQVAGPLLANLFLALATGLSSVARLFGPVIRLFAGFASQVLVQLLPLMMTLAERLLPLFAEAGQKIFDAFAPLLPVLAEFVQVYLAQVAANLPAVIQAFATFLPVLAQVAGIFAGALLEALKAILPDLPRIVKSFSDMALAFLDILVALAPILPPLAKFFAELSRLAVESGILRFAINFLIGVLVVATEVMRRVSRGIEIFIGWLSGARKAAESFGRGVSTAFNTVMSLAGSLGRRIQSAVGNLGSILFNAGKRVIQGLIDGIRAMLPSLAGILGAAAQKVRDYWPFSPAKTGPLSGRGDLRYAGQNIVQRLVEGVNSNLNAARAAAASLAGAFAGPIGPAMPAMAGVGGAGPGGAGTTAAGRGPSTFGPYSLTVDGEVLSRFVIDAVTGAPQTVAAVADEGRRQRAFYHTPGRGVR